MWSIISRFYSQFLRAFQPRRIANWPRQMARREKQPLRMERLESRELFAGNLVVNGSFEVVPLASGYWDTVDYVPGWEVINASGKAEVQKQGLFNWKAGAGNGQQWLELDGDENGNDAFWNDDANDYREPITGRQENGLYGIRQTFATEIGKQYRISFDIAARPGLILKESLIEISVIDDNGILHQNTMFPTVYNRKQPAWQNRTVEFVARSTSTTLDFMGKGKDDTLGVLLDDVRVTEKLVVGQSPISNPLRVNSTLFAPALPNAAILVATFEDSSVQKKAISAASVPQKSL